MKEVESDRSNSSDSSTRYAGLIRQLEKRLLWPKGGQKRKSAEEKEHINGWTFQADQRIYTEYFKHEQAWLRCLCARDQLRQKKAFISVTSLLLSTTMTFISVMAVSVDAEDNGEESETGPLTLGLGITQAVLALLLTIMAGIPKVFGFDSRMQAWDQYCAAQSVPRTASDELLEELQLPPAQRKPYSEWTLLWRAQVQNPRSVASMRPIEPPAVWEATLAKIARRQPEQWEMHFAPFYDARYRGDGLDSQREGVDRQREEEDRQREEEDRQIDSRLKENAGSIRSRAGHPVQKVQTVPWWAWKVDEICYLLSLESFVYFDPIENSAQLVEALNKSSRVQGNLEDYWRNQYQAEQSGRGSMQVGSMQVKGNNQRKSSAPSAATAPSATEHTGLLENSRERCSGSAAE